MNHTCFILTEEERQTKKPMQKFSGYIFFDYECMNDNGEHIPNLIVADKICVECLKTWQVQNEHCANKCGLKTFQNNDDFCLWLLAQEHFTCIAHNLRAYDGLFIMKYLANNRLPNDRSPNVNILQCKLMSIQCDKIKLIDSYNFLPFALSKFSKTFGLEDDQYQKGFFPHLANVPANQNKIFPKLPIIDEYGCKFMNTNDNKRFMDWYAVNKNQVFNLNQELLNYCKSDVKILKQGCLTFRELFMQITQENDNGIDPFQYAITLPSVCHYVFRKMFMPSESIALVADHGFDPTQSHSHKQILWLKIMALSQNIYIKHVYNSKNEFKIGKYPVDGYCAETDTVFQFQGCFHHGCRTCFKPETYNPWRRQSMGYVYKETQERSHFIKTQVKNFVEIWEHEWDDMVKNNLDGIQDIIKELDVKPALRPRDALYGGRTNAAKLYHECCSRQKIKYYDITSLYPFVQKTCKYPIGAPRIITENFSKTEDYFGLIHCKILAPRKLLFPILPTRIDCKLVFALCSSCVLEKSPECVGHTKEQRMLEGTWVTEEVKLAIRHGYIVEKIYSVWHWDQTDQYDPETKTGGLFTGYVNMFLKIKQEASGFPKWCKTEDDVTKYLNDYYENEGIHLDRHKIVKNEGLRSIAKLLLNSMWEVIVCKPTKSNTRWSITSKNFTKFF